VDTLVQDITHEAWLSLRALLRDVSEEVLTWFNKVELDSPSEQDFTLNGGDYHTSENLKTRREEYEYWTQLIEDEITVEDVPAVVEDFDQFFHLCGEDGIDIGDAWYDIQALLDVLSTSRPNLLYVPTRSPIYIPTLVLAVHDDLIKSIAQNPDLLFQIHPRKFEEIIADIFSKRGYEVELTKATRDGGRDVVAVHELMGVRTKFLIECKRYAREHKVSIGFVQRLLGVKVAEAANKAILATTSTFTRDARHFANTHVWDLDLKDYDDIVRWIKAYST